MPAAPPPPPAAAKAAKPDPIPTPTKGRFKIGKAEAGHGERIVIYGVGGVGKSSLAAMAPSPLFIDLDKTGRWLNVDVVQGVQSFADIRSVLHDKELWATSKTAVIDSGSVLQDMAIAHTLETVPHEKGHFVTSVEGYGFGKGYQFVDETFALLLADLDRLAEAGKNVVIVAHETTCVCPNPAGEDFLRYEPMFQQPPRSGRVRDRIKNWCDHLLFIDYDKFVKDGKASGTGTRTIYTAERPTYWAKSRSLPPESIPYKKDDDTIWKMLFKEKT